MMPVLKHKEPCRECPWRRKSAPGWLGASDPDEFVQVTEAEFHMPCHMDIDYEQPDWEAVQLSAAAFCSGGLIFLNNSVHRPRDEELREACDEVGQDTDEVFNWSHEFLDYHKRETV